MTASATASSFRQTALWGDALGMPDAMQRTLDGRQGFAEVSQLLGRSSVRRVIVTGNGAAFYVALATATASLGLPGEGPDWVALPAGLLLGGTLRFRAGDALLVVSSSGELKDVLSALAVGNLPRPFALITNKPESSIAGHADAVAISHIDAQTAVTHTQAYVSNLCVGLSLLAVSRRSVDLGEQLSRAPQLCSAALQEAPAWALRVAPPLAEHRAGIVAAPGLGHPAALEAALLLKEVAALPTEGLEMREAATSGMYALSSGQLLLGLGTALDPLWNETREICASRGATTVLAPGGGLGSESLLSLTSFPAVLALSLALGLERGLDVDRPAWSEAYYRTARQSP